ncbi:hypothetical protein niasHT_039543 [Heterodera trifolii]|uniref:Prostaglandin E synthase 2 n=2 Tax=Heterodera TaxID=34509 RepID=A0ABD2I1Q8_9BILA
MRFPKFTEGMAIVTSVTLPGVIYFSGESRMRGKSDDDQTGDDSEQQKKTWRVLFKRDEANAAKRTDNGIGGKVTLSQKIVSNIDRTGLNLRLYQFAACPYCCKVRAFLDYYGFSYEVVEVHPVTKKALKQLGGGTKKVPVLTTDCYDKPLPESSRVISMLATFMVQPKLPFKEVPEMYSMDMEHVDVRGSDETGKMVTKNPHEYFVMYGDVALTQTQVQLAREEREWRQWVDNTFIHLISPNIYRDIPEALNTFDWFAQTGEWRENFSTFERWMAKYVGASVMLLVTRKLRDRHGIKHHEERHAMREAIKEWFAAKGPHRPFMGGQHPGLADLAFYGAFKSFTGCNAFVEMYNDNKELRKWFDSMEMAVTEGRGRVLLELKSRALAGVDGKQQQQLNTEDNNREEKKECGDKSNDSENKEMKGKRPRGR